MRRYSTVQCLQYCLHHHHHHSASQVKSLTKSGSPYSFPCIFFGVGKISLSLSHCLALFGGRPVASYHIISFVCMYECMYHLRHSVHTNVGKEGCSGSPHNLFSVSTTTAILTQVFNGAKMCVCTPASSLNY